MTIMISMCSFRGACSITNGEEEVIITGGYFTLSTVSVYNLDGWTGDLPSLNTGRYYHACGKYISQNGDRVRYLISDFLLRVLKSVLSMHSKD